jgi:hypothetical protein
MGRRLFVGGLWVLVWTGVLVAGPLDWRLIQTPQSDLYFKPGWEWKAREILEQCDAQRAGLQEWVSLPREKTVVVLDDIGLTFNGSAEYVSRRIRLYTGSPRSTAFDTQYHNVVRLLMTHESTHIAHLSMVATQDRWIRAAVGPFYSPMVTTPEWFIEGMAVVAESGTSPYEGRLNDGSVQGLIRAMAVAHRLPSLAELTMTEYHYPYREMAYNVGGVFLRSLVESTPSALYQWNSEIAARPLGLLLGPLFPSLGIDGAARAVFGRSVPTLYAAWVHEQVSTIETPTESIRETMSGGRKSLLTRAGDCLIFVQESRRFPQPFNFSESRFDVMCFDPKTRETGSIARLLSPVVAPLVVDGRRVLMVLSTLTTGVDNHSKWGVGETGALVELNLESGEMRTLANAPIKAVVIEPNTRTIVAVVPGPNGEGSVIGEFHNGVWTERCLTDIEIGEMAVVGDRIVAIGRTSQEPWGVVDLSLITGKYQRLTQSPWALTKLSVSGDRLVMTSGAGRALNTVDCASDGTDPRQLTVSGGAVFGVIMEDRLFVLRMVGDGMELTSQPVLGRRVSADIQAIRFRNHLDVAVENKRPLGTALDCALPFDGIGSLLGGEDTLGLLTYSLQYDGTLGVGMTAAVVSPIRLSARYSGLVGSEFQAAVPLFRSFLPGLQVLNASGTWANEGWSLGADAVARWTDWRTIVQGRTNVATGGWSAVVAEEWIEDDWKWATRGTSVERYSVIQPRVGGVSDFYETESGSIIRTDFTLKVAEWHLGNWEPNLFLGNGFIHLFAIEGSWEPHSQMGLEGIGELSVGMGRLQIQPKIGVVNQDGVTAPYTQVSMTLLF